jgi:hypothetical protein
MATCGSRDGAPAPAPDGRAKASAWRCNRHPACVPGCGPADAAALAPHGAGSGGGGAHSLTKRVRRAPRWVWTAPQLRRSRAPRRCWRTWRSAARWSMGTPGAVAPGSRGAGMAAGACADMVWRRARTAACLAAGPTAPARAGRFVRVPRAASVRAVINAKAAPPRSSAWITFSFGDVPEPKRAEGGPLSAGRERPRRAARRCMHGPGRSGHAASPATPAPDSARTHIGAARRVISRRAPRSGPP